MKYEPINHTPDELLEKCGFISADRGWVLPKNKQEEGKVCQVHAIVNWGKEIELHLDKLIDGKHESSKTKEKLKRFYQILDDVDLGRSPKLNRAIKKKWKGLQKLEPILLESCVVELPDYFKNKK